MSQWTQVLYAIKLPFPEAQNEGKAVVCQSHFGLYKTLHGEERLLEFVKVRTVELRINPWVKEKYLRCPLYSSTEKSVVLRFITKWYL
jgi:hypothetical protein